MMRNAWATMVVATTVAIVGRAVAENPQQPTADATEGQEKNARKVLESRLAKIAGAERGQVHDLQDGALSAVFPDQHFFVVRFPQYPVAVPPPEPLKENNVFVIGQNNMVERISDREALEEFFKNRFDQGTDLERIKHIARAWLQISQELHQDGYYEFAIPDEAIQLTSIDDRHRVSGKAVVKPQAGNAGEVSVELLFDAAGKLIEIKQRTQLKEGKRPTRSETHSLVPDRRAHQIVERPLRPLGTRWRRIAVCDLWQRRAPRSGFVVRAAR